jgi:hypothetical protein
MFFKNFLFQEAKAFLGPPRQNYKILFLNLMGFQILRYFLSYLKYELFKIENFKSSEVINLNQNGYTIINNFLPKDDLENILKLCEKIEVENKFKIKNYGMKKVHSYDFFGVHDDKDYEISKVKNIILQRINQSSFMNDIFKLLKIKNAAIQSLSYEKIIAEEGFVDKGDIDAEFHADRFYPCIKIFFYLNDNKIENGAFEYISKSHKFSIHRMIHEYWHSIFISHKNFFPNFMKKLGYKLNNERVTFDEKKINKIFGENSVIACEAPKNSLVICNNKGFHKRGRLSSNTTRSHLRINLYDLQISKTKNLILQFAKNFKNNSFKKK